MATTKRRIELHAVNTGVRPTRPCGLYSERIITRSDRLLTEPLPCPRRPETPAPSRSYSPGKPGTRLPSRTPPASHSGPAGCPLLPDREPPRERPQASRPETCPLLRSVRWRYARDLKC